jgi:hypothetical protein
MKLTVALLVFALLLVAGIPALVSASVSTGAVNTPSVSTGAASPPSVSIGGEVGYYAISSSPSGADVYFDDQYQGLSPVSVQVYSTGNPVHNLRVQKSGYQPVEQVLNKNPAAGQTIPVNIVLQPIPTTIPTSPPGAEYGFYKIISVPAGATVMFDGSNYGAAPVSIKVYTTATPGHTLICTLPGYQQYTQQISGNPSSGQTITITATLVPYQQTGNIYVNSNPSGATAILDGSYSQITPGSFVGISSGSHTVEISYPGYQVYYAYPNVNPGQTTNVYAALTPSQNTGSLYVQSSPAGAGVYVDDAYRGESPLTVGNLVQGSHNLKLLLSGYQDYVATVSISTGKTTSIYPALQPVVNPSTGYVMISSTPSGASIYTDGVYRGKTPPTGSFDVSGVVPGPHSILLRLSGYQDYADTGYVSAGQTIVINPTLVPISQPPSGYGSIQVSSSPTGAEAYLDNVFKGYTPLTMQNVVAGSHVVTLKQGGYNDWQTTTQVTSGQITQLSATLTPTATQTPTPTPTPTQTGGLPVACLLAMIGLGCIAWRKNR